MQKKRRPRRSFNTIYTDAHREVVERLRRARAASGLRQVDAAKKLRLPMWYVQKCESGQRRIDVVELMRFAKLYRKPLTFFVDGLPDGDS